MVVNLRVGELKVLSSFESEYLKGSPLESVHQAELD